VLRKTAQQYGWKVTGKFETCKDCQEANAKQKGVQKSTPDRCTTPGERLFIDITSIKKKSIGGSKFWLVIVDDATNFTWSIFLKQKNHTAERVMELLLKLFGSGCNVKYIRCDNAGENKDLENKCKKHDKLCNIQFEYTPRDSPQYNGKAERKIAVLTGRVRSMLTAAGLPDKLRPKLWAEAARTATDVENVIISMKDGTTAYAAFGLDVPNLQHIKQFGEVALVKFAPNIKGKLMNRGIPVIYLGRATGHAADVHRVMSIPTKRIIQTRDAIWLQQTYGEYSGDKRIKDHASPVDSELLAQLQDAVESTSDPPSKVSKEIVILPADTNELMGSPTATPATPSRLSNRVKKPVQILTSNRKGELTDKTLELATAKDFTQAPLVERVHHNNKQLSNPGREAATFSSLPAGIAHPTIEDAAVWVDKFGESAEILSDTAMAATDVDYSKVDPSTYKDIFTVPTTFEEAWNHPCPFQRERWRAGILKEMKKMEENKVWKKIKRSEMPKD
jgi:hypothetical protein